jgi:threonine dehydratase
MTWDERVRKAAIRLGPYIRKTPVNYSEVLSNELGVPVFLKMENQQISGSFKARGAFNRILVEVEKNPKPGFFVTASTGNHASGFGLVLRSLNLEGKVFLPENVAESKMDFIRLLGIPWEQVGNDSLETELTARKMADKQNWIFVSPYNDEDIIAGQGTIAYELLGQLADFEFVIVPVGGGGLISGIASFLKLTHPDVKIIGCQPQNSPEMYLSLQAGRIIHERVSRPTLSDATAGGIEPASITFDLCRQFVDDLILITESEIASAIRWMLKYHQEVIEGAAALSIACARKIASRLKGKKTVLILSGKRLSYSLLKGIICD